MPRVSEDEWTRKYGHGAFCHLAARTEGIMKEGNTVCWLALCVYGKLHSSSSPCWLVYGAASSNDRRTRAIGLKTERLPRRSC